MLPCSLALSPSSPEAPPQPPRTNPGLLSPSSVAGYQVPPPSARSSSATLEGGHHHGTRLRSASAAAAAAAPIVASRLSASASFHRCFQNKQSFDDDDVDDDYDEEDDDDDYYCYYEDEGRAYLASPSTYGVGVSVSGVRGVGEEESEQRRSLMVLMPRGQRARQETARRPAAPRLASGLRHVPAQAMAIVGVGSDGIPWAEEEEGDAKSATFWKPLPSQPPYDGRSRHHHHHHHNHPPPHSSASSSAATLRVPGMQLPLSRSSPEALVRRCVQTPDVSQEDLEKMKPGSALGRIALVTPSPPSPLPPPPSYTSATAALYGAREDPDEEEEDDDEFDDAMEEVDVGEG